MLMVLPKPMKSIRMAFRVFEKGSSMQKKYYDEIVKKSNLRENLSNIRKECKDTTDLKEWKYLFAEGALLIPCLKEEDPKVRKNAALLMGDLCIREAVEPLLLAYETETVLFVKSFYLQALSKLPVEEHLDTFKAYLESLVRLHPQENELKHINEEIRQLQKIITDMEGISKHKFTGLCQKHDILLLTNREQKEATIRELSETAATFRRDAKIKAHPLGVLVTTDDIVTVKKLRTYRELLFPLRKGEFISEDPVKAAAQIANSEFLSLLEEVHQGQTPFYFRVELKSRMPLDKRSAFTKKFSMELERLLDRKVINSTTDYEVEIRLIENREGVFFPALKLYTMVTKRFAYRKNFIPASINPSTAALFMELCAPYMKEDAQILDPFCGVGTMLIERNIKKPARENYGIDVFGEAIEKARENTLLADLQVNYIHRDFFDFKHSYLFDEIVTNMPIRGRKTKEEMDLFYQKFFEKAKEHLEKEGVIFMYTNEVGFVMKQIRVRQEYRLIQDFVINKKDDFHLFIIGLKG